MMTMTMDEALAHIAQVFENVEPDERFPLLLKVIEDQANGHYLAPPVFMNMLREAIKPMPTEGSE